MVHECVMEGLRVQTGDLICTRDGGTDDIKGQFWRLIGKLLPGDVDHIVVYVGPGGRCIESGATGKVIAFDVAQGRWDAATMTGQRGQLIDELYGAAFPFEGKGLSEDGLAAARERVARYCEEQIGKPYNLNFFNSASDDAFYCSQLAYKAFLREGIDLNTGIGVPDIPGTQNIIYPQEIWEGCTHRRAGGTEDRHGY